MADADHNDVGASPEFWAVVAAFLSETEGRELGSRGARAPLPRI